MCGVWVYSAVYGCETHTPPVAKVRKVSRHWDGEETEQHDQLIGGRDLTKPAPEPR
jgi:hypothetical protein